jgi:TP901 family phage tail tape measure protein
MASTVQLQVEVVEKNAEARLKALDKLAKEMGNRKITLNFDEASLARWKAATDGMTSAQLSAYAKLATAAENANARMIAAGQKTTQVEMQQNAKLAIDRQRSFDKKITLYEREDTKRRQIAERTAQAEINANAKVQVATLKGVQGTRQHTQAQKELNAEATKTDSIFSSITSRFTAANLISSLITRGIALLRQALRQAVDEMKEMDKELTTIKMVTGASNSDIYGLRQQAFQGARETGRSTSDYLSAAERFARAGYRENIQALTKLSLVTQNVGGVTEDVASKFILAADAAWKMGGNTERLWSMLDGVTSIADQNATDIGKIAEAYTVAGSAFANAGESERTFAALIGTTTAATQRSGSEMARGLQTILFRVRQVKGELDDGEVINAEDISNAAKALDSVGISVLNDAKELKSFTEIMGELSEKWDTLNTKQKAYLQNALAGNRRGNVLFALMDNWDVYLEQLGQFDESSGTALKKNAEYTDSWAASTENLKTAWTQLVDAMTVGGGVLQKITDKLTESIDKIRPFFEEGSLFWVLTNPGDFWDDLEWDPNAKRFKSKRLKKEFEESSQKAKEAKEAQNALAEATNQVTEVYDDEADAVERLSTAFEKANANIKKASENMKSEKDDSIKSAADIYKAMKEAADKGYYGSNAYKEGAKLFFGTSDKNAIGKIAQDALDTYFDAISKGNYSNAAAALWGNFADESGQIVDKTSGKVIASMKDVGDAFEWTFNKGDQSIGDFLQSMESATGIGADFWASLIQSLGMYSDELDSWFEENEIKTTATIDTTQASQDIDGYNAQLGSIPSEVNTTVTTTFVTNGSPPSFSGGGAGRPFAKGKRDNFSGIALVNDEFPADGSKPELIISKSKGRAYIANGGKPALVNLRSDDIVLSAKETKSAFGVPTFRVGKSGGGILGDDSLFDPHLYDGVEPPPKVTTPKDKDDDNKKKKKDKEKESKEAWDTLKKLIEYLLDKADGELKEMLEALDKQLEELEAQRKEEKQQKELEERQLAVQKALVDLEKAQTERTVRYYNEQTQQWEWMADQGDVEKAKEALKNAEEDLKEYQDDLEYEAKRDAINQQKKDLQEQFDAYKKNWEDIIDIIEAPSGDIQQLLETIFGNASGTLLGEAQNIADLLNTLKAGFLSSGYELGLGRINDNTKDSTTTIDTIFGHQSEATNGGLISTLMGSVGSGIVNDILGQTATGGLAFTADSLRDITGGLDNSLAYRDKNSIVNNNGGNYYVNGVMIGSEMAQRPFAEVMRTIAIHANETA